MLTHGYKLELLGPSPGQWIVTYLPANRDMVQGMKAAIQKPMEQGAVVPVTPKERERGN